jgi:ABC-2 type transport system permease protein
MMQVGKVLDIARVNLVRQVRDRSDLFFVFVLPTIIIVALGLQFGGVTRARLGVIVPAGDVAAEAVVASIAADTTRFEIRRLTDEAALRSQVERGTLEAGLVIPDGFAEALKGNGTAEVAYLGTADALTLGLRAPVEAALARAGALALATRVATSQGAGGWDEAAAAAGKRYDSVPGVQVNVTQVGEPGMFAGYSQFTFGASTQLILFMFLTSMTAAARLVYARQIGVSRRMLSTPTSAWTIVTGEALGRFGIAILQGVYIVVMTAVVFGVSWGDPLAAGAIILLFGVVGAAAALLVGATARNPDQASSMGVFVGLALAALGGCLIPFQTMPEGMQAIARFVPHSWALLGLQELIRNGGGISTVVPNLAVLTLFAVGLMALGAWRFRKAITG